MTEDVGAAFRRGVETGDLDAALVVCSPDVVFHSPVVHKPYEGLEALRVILTAVNQVFEDFRYTAEFGSADGPGHVPSRRTAEPSTGRASRRAGRWSAAARLPVRG